MMVHALQSSRCSALSHAPKADCRAFCCSRSASASVAAGSAKLPGWAGLTLATLCCAPERTRGRLAAERRAARTPKQRENLKEPRKMVNFRANAETRALIMHLAKHLTGGDRTALMHLALAEL